MEGGTRARSENMPHAPLNVNPALIQLTVAVCFMREGCYI